MSARPLGEVVRELGFADEREFHRLVASRDISTPEKLKAFKSWQEGDGSKAGLLALPTLGAPAAVSEKAMPELPRGIHRVYSSIVNLKDLRFVCGMDEPPVTVAHPRFLEQIGKWQAFNRIQKDSSVLVLVTEDATMAEAAMAGDPEHCWVESIPVVVTS